jgi:hypothetical protein
MDSIKVRESRGDLQVILLLPQKKIFRSDYLTNQFDLTIDKLSGDTWLAWQHAGGSVSKSLIFLLLLSACLDLPVSVAAAAARTSIRHLTICL